MFKTIGKGEGRGRGMGVGGGREGWKLSSKVGASLFLMRIFASRFALFVNDQFAAFK